jgi:hypothetical protein
MHDFDTMVHRPDPLAVSGGVRAKIRLAPQVGQGR